MTDANATCRQGVNQCARGNVEDALKVFLGSLAMNPGYAPTWRGLGLVYEKARQDPQAKTAYRR